MKHVEIFTDGACRGNPGRGGYGVLLRYKHHVQKRSGGFAHTTNNRMEIFAAIVGLMCLKEPCRVTLTSDSKYLVDAVEKGWLARWEKNGWVKSDKNRVLNRDMWERLLKLIRQHQVAFVWVKGHASHPDNNECDRLATEAADQPKLPEDEGFTSKDDSLDELF